jgi:hypothetical protein
VVDTANEMEAGRGQTYTAVHASEVAFWPDIETKLLGLLSTVPHDPETLVILESTANGNNFFRDLWDDAVDGKNGYIPFFAPWHEDPANTRGSSPGSDRKEFEGQIGQGPYGEDEPMLQERFGLSLEQLHWRRWRIDQPDIAGDLRKFRQEFPAFPEEAFISTGQQVFDQRRVQILVDRCPKLEHQEGTLTASSKAVKKGRHGVVEVPTQVKWTPKGNGPGAEPPVLAGLGATQEDGRYIVVCDASEGEEIERGESDFHGIQVIDHNTASRLPVTAPGSTLTLSAIRCIWLLCIGTTRSSWSRKRVATGWRCSAGSTSTTSTPAPRSTSAAPTTRRGTGRRTGWAGRPTGPRSRCWSRR